MSGELHENSPASLSEVDLRAETFLRENNASRAKQIAELLKDPSKEQALLTVLEANDIDYASLTTAEQDMLALMITQAVPPPYMPHLFGMDSEAPHAVDWADVMADGAKVEYTLRDSIAQTRALAMAMQITDGKDPLPFLQEEFIENLLAKFMMAKLDIPPELTLQLTEQNIAKVKDELEQVYKHSNFDAYIEKMRQQAAERRAQMADQNIPERMVERILKVENDRLGAAMDRHDLELAQSSDVIAGLCAKHPSLRVLCARLIGGWEGKLF